MSSAKGRYPFLDALRGLAIIDMVVFHFLFDINVLCGKNPGWPYLPEIMLWQRWGLWLFVVVGGASCALMGERARWRRGLKLNLLGLAVTVVTAVLMPKERIVFGVLNFFGCALWLTALLENGGRGLLKRLGATGLALALAGALLFYSHGEEAAEVVGVTLWQWPSWLFQDAFAILGFHSAGFFSADYVPLLPHIFIFWLGYCLMPCLKARAPGLLAACDTRLLTLPGRRTLWIYFLHQPFLLAGLFLAGML